MTEITIIEKEPKTIASILKLIISPFRLMHALPVMTVTIMVGVLTYFSLGGFTPIGPFIMIVISVFFQQAFVGIHNDYFDHQQDISYKKRKAIADGWVSAKTAFWFSIAFYVIFSGLSFGLGHYARIGYWIVLYLQGINLLCLLYNFFLKNTPFSIVPYLIAFPTAPFFVWLCFEDFAVFNWNKLWYIAVLICAAIVGHLANEIPDYDYDIQYKKRNTAVVLGKKASTIIYVIASFLSQLVIIIPYVLYSLNDLAFIIIMSLSTLTGLTALGFLVKNKWNTDTFTFNLFTGHIGINTLGIIFLFNV